VLWFGIAPTRYLQMAVEAVRVVTAS
jgi:hypothetical protein